MKEATGHLFFPDGSPLSVAMARFIEGPLRLLHIPRRDRSGLTHHECCNIDTVGAGVTFYKAREREGTGARSSSSFPSETRFPGFAGAGKFLLLTFNHMVPFEQARRPTTTPIDTDADSRRISVNFERGVRVGWVCLKHFGLLYDATPHRVT